MHNCYDYYVKLTEYEEKIRISRLKLDIMRDRLLQFRSKEVNRLKTYEEDKKRLVRRIELVIFNLKKSAALTFKRSNLSVNESNDRKICQLQHRINEVVAAERDMSTMFYVPVYLQECNVSAVIKLVPS